jgi:hypothetical protein
MAVLGARSLAGALIAAGCCARPAAARSMHIVKTTGLNSEDLICSPSFASN